MPSNINQYYWFEAEQGGTAAQAPTTDPLQQGATAQPMPPANMQPNQQVGPTPPEEDQDVTEDPQDPEENEEEEKEKDFEQWRHEFFDLAIKCDPNELISSVRHVRDRELEPSQRKFVEDNLAISLYRQDANIAKASQEIRNLIKKDLDRINPGTTVMQHITATLEKMPVLQENFIKMLGLFGMKGDVHRQFTASLLGAVQVGGGGEKEDIIFVDKDYTINISTRFYSDFGEINIGKWSLKTDDPEKYLTEPELKRLTEGSPEERQVLRRRVIIESIAKKYKNRSYIIHIVSQDGTVYCLGWDLGNSLLAAYKDGKIIVRGRDSEINDAQITDAGEIVPVIDLDILYVKETGEVDNNGKPEAEEITFMERRNSILYLKADSELIQTAADAMSGMFFRQLPWNGNPSSIRVLSRCTCNIQEILSKRCYGG
jgi:hypothetical protein